MLKVKSFTAIAEMNYQQISNEFDIGEDMTSCIMIKPTKGLYLHTHTYTTRTHATHTHTDIYKYTHIHIYTSNNYKTLQNHYILLIKFNFDKSIL